GTTMFPHGISFLQRNVQVASLDHAMWFHRPFRVDEWLLYSCDSPTAQGARGLARGMVYSEDGRLVASTAQDGLVRLRIEPAQDRPMRPIYTSPRMANIERVAALLAEHGIQTSIGNRSAYQGSDWKRFSYTARGDRDAWPQVMIARADDLPLARRLLRE